MHSGHDSLPVDWDDILWASLTVGRPNTAYVLAHGDASCYEALFRLSLVRMAMEQRPYSVFLHRTDAFRSLDLTEKGAISYFLGMTFCKLFAFCLLRTTWLLNLDVFRNQLAPVLLGGRSRPDLIGLDDVGAWHAFECKGRSSVPSKDDRRKAKEQALRLVRVDSKDCALHIGTISYFRQSRLEFHWRDPDPRNPEKLDPLEVNLPKDAWRHYYAPILALYNLGKSEAISDARTAPEMDIEIHPALLDALSSGEWTAARIRAQELRHALQVDGFRLDGLKVSAGSSWSRKHGSGEFEL